MALRAVQDLSLRAAQRQNLTGKNHAESRDGDAISSCVRVSCFCAIAIPLVNENTAKLVKSNFAVSYSGGFSGSLLHYFIFRLETAPKLNGSVLPAAVLGEHAENILKRF